MITSQSHHTQNDGVLSAKGGFSQRQVWRTQLHETHFGQYCLQSGSLLQRPSPSGFSAASEFMIISASKYVRTML